MTDPTGAPEVAGRVPEWLPFEAEEGYPTEEWLEHFESRRYGPGDAARFLVNDLPEIVKQISCVRLDVTDGETDLGRPAKNIYYATGGWSGAEDLIGAMLGHFWIKHLHVRWERGGAYWFEVPVAMLDVAPGHAALDKPNAR